LASLSGEVRIPDGVNGTSTSQSRSRTNHSTFS
jgi:hypothetical protein